MREKSPRLLLVISVLVLFAQSLLAREELEGIPHGVDAWQESPEVRELVSKFERETTTQEIERIRKRIKDATPYQLYQIIDGAKIAAFSKESMIKNGFADEQDEQDLAQWDFLIKYCNEVVLNDVTIQSAPRRYAEDIRLFKLVTGFIKQAIVLLHARFGSMFTKINEKTMPDPKALSASLVDRKRLKAIIAKAEKLIAKAASSLLFALSTMAQQSQPAESWTVKLYKMTKKPSGITGEKRELATQLLNKVAQRGLDPNLMHELKKLGATFENKDTADFFRGYKRFFKAAGALGAHPNKSQLTQFLAKHKVIDERSADSMIDKLDQVLYIQTQKIRKEKLSTAPRRGVINEREEVRDTAKNLIRSIRELYPEIVTKLELATIAETLDKSSVIMIAQSGGLRDVLKAVARESRQLAEALKGAPVVKPTRTEELIKRFSSPAQAG